MGFNWTFSFLFNYKQIQSNKFSNRANDATRAAAATKLFFLSCLLFWPG